ncbi:hypothetical protein [Pectobacterium wasabiae]|uniref:Uncharacterized protein n=1 Tax=Pectobacterium wasabiae TaxID=55208 RepID=A0AAW3EJQ7_9GAMM|nr:hypothetical protein [Pectobacterium wasabiae]AOR63852.1 hypothetical protein A7983_11385 [Pectobacterium wasabiae CFBP 3304]EJS94244.1 Hypothetical protein Y17_2290 [Pectobacterium wasabiae CFBP 3304]KFX08471.1 hypothetical protein JV38_06995 [Pectobacterium wasabiae]KGA28498.1 hypothetical protein KU73_10715 [Pectobacterium wasabiae]
MKLSDFCLSIYKEQDRVNQNGIAPVQGEINAMIQLIYKEYNNGLRQYAAPYRADEVVSFCMSENEQFDEKNLADLIALVFDAITENNRNPMLWGDTVSIQAEIAHTFTVLIHGSEGEVLPNGTGPLSKGFTSYDAIKEAFIKELEKKPFNLF